MCNRIPAVYRNPIIIIYATNYCKFKYRNVVFVNKLDILNKNVVKDRDCHNVHLSTTDGVMERQKEMRHGIDSFLRVYK